MFNKIKKILFFALAICCVTCFAIGCNNAQNDEKYIPEKLVLNFTEKTLNVGDSFRLYVVDSQNLKLSWESDDNKVAEVMQDGTVIAIGAGQTKINVKALEQNIPVSTCLVKVNSSSGAKLVKFDYFEKSLLVNSEFELKATVYSDDGEIDVLPQISYNSLTEGVSAESIIKVNQSGNVLTVKGQQSGIVQILAKIDDSIASCVVKIMDEAEFEASELMVEPYIRYNTVNFLGFPSVEYFLDVNGEKVVADFMVEGDNFSLYLPDYLPEKVDYYKIKIGYEYKGTTCYTKTFDYDTESIGLYNGFTGALSNNEEYIAVELDENVVSNNEGKSLKVTAKPNTATVPLANRPSLTVSFVNHTDYSWANGVSQVSWKVYLDSSSFVDVNGNAINAKEFVTAKNETVNLIDTMKYDMALLGDNDLCITDLSKETFITVSGKGADKWMKFTLNIDPVDFDKFFTIDETNGIESFKLAMFNTNGYLGFVVDETSDYIKSTGIGYSFYVDDMSFMNIENKEFEGSYVGSLSYFAVGLDVFEDYNGDGASLKVTAKAHSDNIGINARSSHTAIYLPYSGDIITNGVITATWKAKIDKASFKKSDGSTPTIDYTNFYKCGLLTNNATWFGENSATLNYVAEDANGWVAYTLSITQEDFDKFIITNNGLTYFKLNCMNTSAALYNDSKWVSPSNTSYEFYVDDLSFATVSGEFIGTSVGSPSYFAVSYSQNSNFVTSDDGDSLKIIAKAHSDAIGANVRAQHTAIYMPFSGNLPTNDVTVIWKAKIDKNSFVTIDGTPATGINFNENFYKAAMLTNNAAFFGTNSATLSYDAEDVNGWINYSLTIPKEDISKFIVELGGEYYFKLVCMNTGATLLNNGNWTSPTSIGYEFYVDELTFSEK